VHACTHLLEQLEQRPAVAVHDVRLAAAAAGVVVDAVGDAAGVAATARGWRWAESGWILVMAIVGFF
jgi:hypothetical protein